MKQPIPTHLQPPQLGSAYGRRLSPRRMQVAELVGQGLTDKQVANGLDLPGTERPPKRYTADHRIDPRKRFVRWVAILCACVAIGVGTARTTSAGDPSPVPPDGSKAFDAFRDFVTGRTAVKYALVEITLNRLEVDRLFAFAYDSHAFFARAYCTNKHDLNGLCLRDKLCGRKGGRYWYYNGDVQTPLLYTSSSPEDTTAGAYGGVTSYFNILAGLYQTYSLSDQGLNSLAFRNGRFEVEYSTKTRSCTAHIRLDQGIPTVAELEWRDSDGHVVKDRVFFSYDTAEARARGLPTSSRAEGSGFGLRVLELQLLASGERVLDPPFIPPSLFSSTNVGRVIHSNKTDYFMFPDGSLSPMDGRIPDREMANLRAGRRFFYLGAAALLALSLPLLRICSNSNKQHHATNPR